MAMLLVWHVLVVLIVAPRAVLGFHNHDLPVNHRCLVIAKHTKTGRLASPLPIPPRSNHGQKSSALAVSGGGTGDALLVARESSSSLLRDSLIVGSLTAGMGYLYGKVLSASVFSLWQKLPAMLLEHNARLVHPTLYITAMGVTGGFLVGLLSLLWQKDSFTVADFVQRASNNQALPSARRALGPLLILSLLTSSFGFSVGPEAPMVCAGALVGADYANRKRGRSKDSNNQQSRAQILSYAGAAGALTAFMGIPIAGSIFALELAQSSAGIANNSVAALGPVAAASCAGLVLLRGLLQPKAAVGGHFLYSTIGRAVSGRQLIGTAVGAGIGGAVLGTLFVKLVSALKKICWSTAPASSKQGSDASVMQRYRPVIVKTMIGLIVGLLSSRFPQTLFWGEGSLQCVIDGQKTAFVATKHGIPSAFTASALVNPNLPFANAKAAAMVGAAKFCSIALACAGKFPGGIIFPLFFAAAPLAHSLALAVAGSSCCTIVTPMLVMSLMASTQASVTKTPLATALILALSASPFSELSVLWPSCLVASYVGVWVSELLSKETYFSYEKA